MNGTTPTPAVWRPWMLVCLDAVVVFLSYLTVLVVRFAGSVPMKWSDRFWVLAIPVAALSVLVNLLFGLYEAERPPRRAFLAGVVTTILVVAFCWWVRAVPLSVAVGGGLLSALGFAGLRLGER